MPSAEFLTVPEGMRLYAVGDIHGQLRQVRSAIEWLNLQTAANTLQELRSTIVFLGDYIDRGDNSRAVIELLSGLHDESLRQWVFLAGNHEASMLAFLKRPEDHAAWLRFGGIETLTSYGVRPPMDTSRRALRRCRDELAQALPSHHLAFLQSLRPSFQCGDYLFAHAGIRPGVPFERQAPEDLLWIREDFLDYPLWHGRCVVHGHTIEAEPALHPWRIGIDTGAYAGGQLTCLTLADNRRNVVGFR